MNRKMNWGDIVRYRKVSKVNKNNAILFLYFYFLRFDKQPLKETAALEQ